MDFLNGPFLAATAAAAVPVIIHLVQRRRVKQVTFSSVRLLRKTPHRVVHRRRFEEVLLVVLRALALAVLAAAFARPFFPAPAEAGVGGATFLGEQAALLLIDNSWSMRAEGRMERARQEALKFLQQAPPAVKVGVASFSRQFDELCPIGSTLPQADQAVRGIAAGWGGTRLDLALKQADRLLTRAGRNEAARRIVLISDFHSGSWHGPGDGSAAGGGPTAWKLSPGVDLTILNVASRGVPNVAVGPVVVPRLVVAGGFVEVVSANVRDLTDKPLTDATVTFRVEGRETGTRTVNLRPGEDTPVRFLHKFTDPGDVTGTIAIRADDEMGEDNAVSFCVHVTPRVRVLLVNGDRGEPMARNGGLFLKTALVPGAGQQVSPFELREVAPEQMTPADLDSADVVLLVNASKVPPAVTDVPAAAPQGEGREFLSPLGRFVAAGGGVGFFCGKKVVPEEFNRAFGDLAPCRLSRLALAAGDPPVVINQVDLRHEVFSAFAQPHSGDLSLAEFTQHFLVSDSLRASVLARFSGKDARPALLERSFDRDDSGGQPPAAPAAATAVRAKGKTILFASTADLEWNNLCLKSVFVPFMHQITKRLCSRRTGEARNFTVGEEITHPLAKATGQARLRRQAAQAPAPVVPDGKPAPAGGVQQWDDPIVLNAQPAGGAGAVTFTPRRPGVYELAFEGDTARFAVNLDPAEADLRPMDTRLLLSAVQKGPAPAEAAGHGAVSVVTRATLLERAEARQKAWRYLLLAVVGLLVVEMLLARRIGRA